MREEEVDEKETTLMEDKIAFLKSLYAPENTNGYNRRAYIVRDYLKYPLNSYIEYNAKLNAFDDEDALIMYIIHRGLEKQR
jgi:restriction endonuclease S subunit